MKKINIIFDNNDSNALSIINNIYKEFSYDYENLYSVNLGYCIKLIPTKEDLKYIDKEVDLIIWLISSSFFLDTEAYTLKFNELKKQGINQLPISICSTDAILFDEINTLIIKDNQSITELLCVIAQKLIGEKIDIIQSNLNYYVIVIKPQISCSTKEMYQKLDERKKVIQKDNTINIKLALEQSNFNLLTKNLYNVFEEIIDEKDIIQNLKKELEKNGAKASLMAGSGSCIFGIFDNKNIAKQAYNKLKQQYETYICKTCNKKGLKYDRK